MHDFNMNSSDGPSPWAQSPSLGEDGFHIRARQDLRAGLYHLIATGLARRPYSMQNLYNLVAEIVPPDKQLNSLPLLSVDSD